MIQSSSYQSWNQQAQIGSFQSAYSNDTQQIRFKEESFSTFQPVVPQQGTWTSSQLGGRVEEKDFLVIQRTNTFGKSEAERQQHYEELIQDNQRMREVIEELKREVATYKASSSSDAEMLRKELQITQKELEAANKEIMMLKSGVESRQKTEMENIQMELEKWKKRCAELESKDKENMEQLKQLTYYQNKLKWYEMDAKKKFEKYQTVDLLQQQLSDQESLIEELKKEIHRWEERYDAQALESQEIRIKLSSNTRVNQMEDDIKAYIHEIGQWKKRCSALEARFEASDEAKLLARIDQLNRLLAERDQDVQKSRAQLNLQISQQQQSKLLSSAMQNQEFDNQLEQLRRQLQDSQNKLEQQNRDMEGYKMQANLFNSDKFEELEQEKWKLELQIEELERDCDTFMLRIKELEQQFQELSVKYNEQNANYLKYKEIIDSNSSKYKNVDNLTKEIQNYQKDLEVWKTRYFQTEIRLKEYDSLRIEYEKLLKQQQQTTIQSTFINIETDAQYIQIKRERDMLQKQISDLETKLREQSSNSFREQQNTGFKFQQDDSIRIERDNYYNKIQELELRIKELQQQQSQSVKYSNDDSKVRELEAKIREYLFQIKSYESRISTYETKIREFETRNKEYETRNTQSLVEKTVVLTDEPKIKELTEIIQQKNKRIIELEQNANYTMSNQSSVVVIKEQVRVKDQRIRELEIQVDNLQLELGRLQNLKRDQESRINIMLQKITEYESQLNILQEVKLRQSKRSPPPQQSKITSTTYIQQQQQQPIIQTNSYIKQNNAQSTIYQSAQQIVPSPAPISQNIGFQQMNNSLTTTRQVVITGDSLKNLYPKEENISSQILDRIAPNRITQDLNGQQSPQIIVSQYKPIN
ncbi:unnamed protein product (macronuclear) [Paramecium tetraurelia]|uniref:Uncharacterized protein n=1 Tax=Paramecium tetraurelia TaxID=5888 RepID=A0E1L9_PARTE|nr:uncharacterized protein GSPATT00022356001 [Paramecium tetraurelia]CAK89186.1 unnamed protein product [Paramecium tetraurelia]|eukprot:XP_001456583.1 hypothetical protein (macronuclear) [Paramecium tetraurelia strain d4-2]